LKVRRGWRHGTAAALFRGVARRCYRVPSEVFMRFARFALGVLGGLFLVAGCHQDSGMAGVGGDGGGGGGVGVDLRFPRDLRAAVEPDLAAGGGGGSPDLATGGGSPDLSTGGATEDLAMAVTDGAGSPTDDLATSGSPDLAGGGFPTYGGFTGVWTIVLENTSYSTVVNGTTDPFIQSLIANYALATNYSDSLTHPSLPNYLYMISGDTQYIGILDYNATTCIPLIGPCFPHDNDNLGNQLQTAGIPWRAYAEGENTPCNLVDDSSTGPYMTKHVPFLYFTDIQKNATVCDQTQVDYAQNFPTDLAAGTYPYMWITPNMIDDGHNTDLATADTWLSMEVPKIMQSPIYKAGGVIFITWDEGEGTLSTDDHVAMIIVSPKVVSAGYQSSTAYSHASYLRTVEEIFGLPLLGAAPQAQNMMEFFK
jgi:hypothetical protein